MSGEGGPRRRRELTIMLMSDGGTDHRSFRLGYYTLRLLSIGAVAVALALTVMAGSWWYLAARAARAEVLEREVGVMTRDRERLAALVQRLELIEEQYGHIRSLFGLAQGEIPSHIWLPPSAGAAARGSRSGSFQEGPTPPTVWPLTERGFVTQGIHEGIESGHPGLDIAVATDSYIRAAGGGTVTDVGDDAVYGRFVVIDHGDGYTTLYGHASMTLVGLGELVRERQVIAISGSTGRSTGPHLHFEVLRDGEPIDPLEVVEQPS